MTKTRITYYLRGQSNKRYTMEVATELSDDTVRQLKITNHIINKVYHYKPAVIPNYKPFAVRVDRGPVLHTDLDQKEAIALAKVEQAARPEYTIIIYNKVHSDSIKKAWDKKRQKA